MTRPYILEAIGINKRFGDLAALKDVSLRLRKGSFHALLGENGAGKSTLVKCIMGYYQPDEGEVIFGDHQRTIANPQEALKIGIGMVYQHFTLIPNMTVAENIILSRPELPQVIQWKQEIALLEKRMQKMPFKIDLNAQINHLAAGEKQKVEITKQLLLDTKVLILDEPSSVLTPDEADEMLGLIKELTVKEDLSVLIITHKFREVMSFADEVTVLRKGQWVGSKSIGEVDSSILAEMMIGEKNVVSSLEKIEPTERKEKLSIEELRIDDDTGVEVVSNLSLSLLNQEIVGIAGVSGNGQKELVQVLTGQREAVSGSVKIEGNVYHAKRREMDAHKINCLPEEPLKNACVSNMSVAENLVFRSFDKAEFTRFGWLINRKAISENAKRLIEKFSIRTPSAENPIGNLSGGNVQRGVLARELEGDVEILVVANPCFGLDFGAVDTIHKQIVKARNRGAGVLLVSEDLDEILKLSDRICVMSEGSLVYETINQSADVSLIGKYMAGQNEH